MDEFWAEGSGRSPWAEMVLGRFLDLTGQVEVRLDWLETTGEIIARPVTDSDEGPVGLLGRAPSYEVACAAVWANLVVRPRGIDWASRRIAYIGDGPAGRQKAMVADHYAREKAWQRVCRDAERRTFSVGNVADLPPVDLEEEGLPATPSGRCRCDHCQGDWLKIAAASVQALEDGIDPLDYEAVTRFALKSLSSDADRLWLASLFRDPIALYSWDAGYFVNGRHRTHALREAGVTRCAVSVGHYLPDDYLRQMNHHA